MGCLRENSVRKLKIYSEETKRMWLPIASSYCLAQFAARPPASFTLSKRQPKKH